MSTGQEGERGAPGSGLVDEPTFGLRNGLLQWEGQIMMDHGARELIPRIPFILTDAGLTRDTESAVGLALSISDFGGQFPAILVGPGDVQSSLVDQVIDQAGQLD